jgi:hypothetical protein
LIIRGYIGENETAKMEAMNCVDYENSQTIDWEQSDLQMLGMDVWFGIAPRNDTSPSSAMSISLASLVVGFLGFFFASN